MRTGRSLIPDKMLRKRISLKKIVWLLFLACVCCSVVIFYDTYSQGQHDFIVTSPGNVLYSNSTTTMWLNAFTPQPVESINFYSITSQKVADALSRYKTLSSCSGLTFPDELMVENRWQKVDPDKSAYVFSAYHEGQIVKVIGAIQMNYARIPLTCQLWYMSTQTSTVSMVTVPAFVNIIPENHGRRYTANTYTCQGAQTYDNATLIAVSISQTACTHPLNVVPVTQNTNSTTNNTFTICVTPFSNKYARAYELIEWIELNKILGADKFIFYNYSSAANVERVLRSYSDTGLVEVVDWRLPMKVPIWPPNGVTEEIHYNGQMASMNDCLLRSRGRSEYVVNLDLDEFIIPRGRNVQTLAMMMEQLPKASVYIFANVFFRKEWNSSRTDFLGYTDANTYRLVTLLRLQHEKYIWPYNQRSKYIVRPHDVSVLGIHNVWEKKGITQNVPHTVALLHHYRNWMKYYDKQDRRTDDIIVRKYKDKLLGNVADKWKALPDLVYDIPLCEHPRDFGAC